MGKCLLRVLGSVLLLLAVVLPLAGGSVGAQDADPYSTPIGGEFQPAQESSAGGDPGVMPAEYMYYSEGEVGTYSLFDTPEGPGTICAVSEFGQRPWVLITPVQVFASPGQSSQLVAVYAMVWLIEPGGEFTLFNWRSFTGTTDPNSGSVWLPAQGVGFDVFAGFEGSVITAVEIVWYDGSYDNPIGYMDLEIEHYDASEIGGGFNENACYFETYAPTPTPIPGGFRPGDLLETTASVNLREGPSTSYPVVTTLPSKTIVDVAGLPTRTGSYWWYPVWVPDRELIGYIREDFLIKAPITPTPTSTATATATRTATRTATSTRTATLSPTPSLTATASNTPTATFTPTATATASNTPTASNTATTTNTPTVTNTPTPSNTPTATQTASNTATATNTATASNTPTATFTPTQTLTPSNTATRTNTPVATNTFTASPTRTATRTPTLIPGGFAPGTQVRTTASVNLRSGPGTNYSVLGVVPSTARGAVTGYPIIAGGYTWYPVSMNGFPAGYIAGQYLTTSGVSTSTPTRTPTSTRTATSNVTITPSNTGTSTATRTATSDVTLTPSTTGTVTATRTATGTSTVVTSTPTRTATRTPSTIPGGFTPGDTVRTTASVNLRSGPGTTYSSFAILPSNTNGVVTGYPIAAGGYIWYPVSMNGYPAGYLAGNYLAKTGSGPTVTPTRTRTPSATATMGTRTPTRTVTVTRTATTIPGIFQPGETVQVTTSLNLRSGPGTSYNSLGVMARGTTGTVTGAPQQVGSVLWYPVNMTGFGQGWASGQYLTNVITSSLEPSETAIPTDLPSDVPTEVIVEPTLEPVSTATEVVIPTTVPEPPTEVPVPTEEPTVASEEPPVEEEAA